ncbi:hypothetical protein [Luteibacter sp. UNCMF366Tsu5.1]|uniref:hypothetical protein n=1 Tax=Luteibacter sp. UNCMF366Tsu5.1 TaxID=1502758 RepID=UPI000908EEC6|nr:hypothetical protein [Luteibacter sp. UNCMF366Tsu5.1]SFW24880.1 hypothetical protein SAMN02800691_0522 [Luteibacter sp. UNCMF366Tsu5.1]
MHWIDPDHLPITRGKIARLLLNPHGHLDGVLLKDGTEVHIPPHLSGKLLPRMKIGDSIAVRGVRVRGKPLIVAVAVEPAHGAAVVDNGPQAEKTVERHTPTKAERWGYSGVIEYLVHGPKGDVHGVILDDGVHLRFPPHAAKRFANVLKVGREIEVEGTWHESPHGVVIHADHLARAGRPLEAVE